MKLIKKSSHKMKVYLLVTSLLLTVLSMPILANFLSVSQNPAPVVAKPKSSVVAVAKTPVTVGTVKPLAKKKAKKVTKKAKAITKDSLAVDMDPTQVSSPLYENKNLELN